MHRLLAVLSAVLWLLRSFVSLWFTLLSRWISADQKFQLPAIESSILLQPATVLARRIRERQITAKEVIRVHIDRIRSIQPLLNVYIDERFAEALSEAEEIDRILDENHSVPERWSEERAPFLGVPFAIKESMQFTGFHNATGILARKDFICKETARAVEHMIQAGAILLCNTNVSEGCMWFETRNILYGTTNNPYDLTRTVGGSSGGAGCIVSAAGVPFAVGSDIGGSIRLPSFMNGIFGHKPTPDIVPNEGQYPPHKEHHQKYLLATGPMCRYAVDLQPMLRVLAGKANVQRLLQMETKVDLSRLKYFYVDEMDAYFVNKVDRDQRHAHRRVVDHFEKTFGVHVTRLRLTRLRQPVALWASMMVNGELSSSEFSLHLGNARTPANGYRELFLKCFRRSPHTFPSIAMLILESLPNKYNRRFHSLAQKIFEEIQSLLGENGVIFFPTFPHSAPRHGWPVWMNTFDYIYCGIFNALGLPSTQCPLGLDGEQLPLGIQCVSGRGHDRLSLAVAEEIEQAMGGWVSPSVLRCYQVFALANDKDLVQSFGTSENERSNLARSTPKLMTT